MKKLKIWKIKRNNIIGREIAKSFAKGTSQVEIAKEVLRVQRDEGLWTASQTKDGISISRTKITNKQYNTALKSLSVLDERNE